jgi:superfamily II DNA or RNA helicase
MNLTNNIGSNRVVDIIRMSIYQDICVDIASPKFSIFAFYEIRDLLYKAGNSRMIIPLLNNCDPELLGLSGDRPSRNRLNLRWIARDCLQWINNKIEIRSSSDYLPQSTIYIHNADSSQRTVITGNCPLTTYGLGITPGNQLGLIYYTETIDEAALLAKWFENLWDASFISPSSKEILISSLHELSEHKSASHVYYQVLYQLFKARGDELDEERIVKSATGIKNTKVWKKLFKFQRDGVVGAIEKLERFGGCIIADSVGLGKTFEALAIIKYYELRNDRVLVLAPKRLRENWTLYKANDRRNILAEDRFNYDVLNHTDLSRDVGTSGDIDLANINWGNYDLVVIDESHNFRNKATHRDRETRYDRLMRKIIKSGVKTRVLMLSATPVNNRLADLRNQIAFITEGNDTALFEHGIASIEATTRLAQRQFNRWLDLEEQDRTPSVLIDMLGFDYFQLLDLVTIARSRKHIEKYYGLLETGEFPARLKPINIKLDVDRAGEFRSIKEINNEIRRLNLAAYAPLRYVLPHRQEAYDKKYSTEIRGGESFFRQVDREESLVHLLRVNVLKRMESAVSSFALTIGRQISDVESILSRIESHSETVDEVNIADIDVDDSAFEALLVGNKVKVLLKDVDLIRWRQELIEDRNRLLTLFTAAKQVDALRDAKLEALRQMIWQKCNNPINEGNKKIIVFTAFADTAHYLYGQLADWALSELGIHSALVTGTGSNKTTIPNLRHDLSTILTTFSPLTKERPEEFKYEGEIDLLIATDCISEGQNLQDCDWLINYDIHWNPVRIIQRFGRIDRIGSPNNRIQLVNFWPNMELEEYINLEQRVSGRMVLLDISATGEENLIELQSGNQMNDLEYRRKQLLKLQEKVIDLEDLSSGVSITDLTLTDFRIDLAGFLRDHKELLERMPLGVSSVITTPSVTDAAIPPGVVFCIRAEANLVEKLPELNYPLAPHYLIHVGEDGTLLLPFNQAKQILDRLRKLCIGRDYPDDAACVRFDKMTSDGKNMEKAQELLAAAVASIVGKTEEKSVASLFSPGGTIVNKTEFAGINDFEVVAYLIVLPEVID